MLWGSIPVGPDPLEILMAENGSVRISIEVEKEVHNKLQIICPWGTKAEIMRGLIDCLIKAYAKGNEDVAFQLLRGNVQLTVVQNLNTNGGP